MSTKKDQLNVQPSDAPAKRKRSPRRTQQVAIVPAEVRSSRLSPEAIRARAYWDGYLAALKAIPEPSRWQAVWTVAVYVGGAACLMYIGGDMTHGYLEARGQIVSVRTCAPVMLMDLDSRKRRLEEQIESLQPRGYAALEAR